MTNDVSTTNAATAKVSPSGAQTDSALTTAGARRVGTITMGIGLIATGGLLCVSLFYPSVELVLLARLAPLLLVLLGIEILVCHARAKTVPIKYDVLSILLCGFIIVCGFGATCAVAAMLFESGFYGTMPVPILS